MASVIKAGNATDGIAVSSDNTGILELKTGTGSGTTAVTIGTDQSVTFAAGTSINGITVGRGGGSVATNTAVGASALAANTTGSGNHAFGNGALASNTGANNQSAFGYQALYSSNRTSDNNAGNSAFGYQAAYATTTGQYNSAFGWSALVGNTTGNDNVAVGKWSLKSNTSGSNNVAVGLDSLQANTTASNNTAVGYQAGYSNTTGTRKSAFGYQAGYTGTVNSFSVYVGSLAGYVSTGDSNTMLGDASGYSTTTGTNNTFLGQSSGYDVTTGSKNTIVGRYTGNQNSLDIRTLSNNIVLSDGDGNAKGVYDDKGGSTFVSTTIGSITGGGAAANLCSTGSIWRTNNTLQSAIVLVTASGSNNLDSGWSGAWILHCYKSFGTYTVTVMSSNLYLGSAGYSFTFSLDASNLKVSAGKTTGFTYVVERLGANGTA